VRVIGSEASGAGVTSVGSGDQGQDIIFLPGGGRRYQPFDITSAEHTYDFGQRQWLTAKLRRLAVAVLGHYALSSKVETYIEILFTHRESQTNLAPQAIGNSATNAFPGGFQVPLTNPFVPDDFRQLVQQLEPDARSIALLRRLLEAGDRHSKIIIDSLQVIGGLRGRVARKYDWDLRVNWGQGASTTTIFNSINLARAVETADPELCALNASRGCVVGDYFSPGGLTQDVIDYIRYDDISTASGSQLITQATLTGPVLEIGDREVKFAAGSSFRHEEAEVLPSPIVAGGDSAGNGSSPTVGDLSAYDAFAELSIPLLSKAFLAQQLTADLAGRYSAYDSFGGQFTFRSGLTYAPVADIRLRGSYATAFRAPSIGALYGGSVDSFESVKDPCDGWDTDASIDPTVRQNCMNGGAGIGAVPGGYRQLGSQIRANIGGNRDLQPETARVISMGVVVWPGGPFEGLTLTTDYYRVTVDNAISSPDTQSILDDCYASPALSSPKCELIGRSAEDGSINSLNASVRNIGKLETSGVDLTVNYELGVGSLGQINFGWQGNYLLDFTETIETEVSEFEGTIAPQAGTFTQLRWIARGGFSRGPWSLDNTVRYFGGARLFGVKPDEQPTTSVSAITYWDLAGTYAGDKLGITVGVDNLLDTPPPFIPGENANTNEATYDVVGRFVFTRLSYEF
jgi:outer membrane receptor protein involved in Fe transport